MPSQARASNVSEAMSQGNLLVVDDDIGLRETVADFLTAEGYAVREAANVSEARSQIAAGVPDLILLDINMPKLTGLEVLRAVKASPEFGQIPTVMLTTSARDEDRAASLGSGADDYIIKPVNFRKFSESLFGLLDRCFG